MPTCRGCGFSSNDMKDFPPALSFYNDMRCGKCGTTDVDANDEYQENLEEGFKRLEEKERLDVGEGG